MKLFLDDVREPKNAYSYMKDSVYLMTDWEVVRSYNEFCSFIEKMYSETGGIPDFISFDHDLANEHYVCVTQEHKPIPC